MEEKEKSSLSVDIDKDILLKFKSMCVLREHTMSEEIEKMISDWVELNKGEPASPGRAKPTENDDVPNDAGQPSDTTDLSDKLEEQAEKS